MNLSLGQDKTAILSCPSSTSTTVSLLKEIFAKFIAEMV